MATANTKAVAGSSRHNELKAMLETRRRELAQDWADRVITRPEWLTARKRIEDRLTLARRQLAALSKTSALADYVGNSSELRARWADLPLSRQHAIVAAVLDHVVVNPGRRGFNRFDPSRFDPVWRA